MGLPPLRPTPHLAALLSPEEEVIYTPRLHPLHGGAWLAAALACTAAGWLTPWALVPAGALLAVYLIPFLTNEIAITTHRLLLRMGRFSLAFNDIAPDHLNHIQFYQNPFTNVMDGGQLILNLNKGDDVIALQLPMLINPMRFIEALGTLTPHLRTQAGPTRPRVK